MPNHSLLNKLKSISVDSLLVCVSIKLALAVMALAVIMLGQALKCYPYLRVIAHGKQSGQQLKAQQGEACTWP